MGASFAEIMSAFIYVHSTTCAYSKVFGSSHLDTKQSKLIRFTRNLFCLPKVCGVMLLKLMQGAMSI